MNYFLNILVFFEIYLILSMSLNVMLGYTGLISIAHASFYGIGAYVFSLLMSNTGAEYYLSILGSVLIAVIFSYLISLASLKFKGDYFVLATLAFQYITYSILYNWVSLTRGSHGIINISRPSIFGATIHSLWGFAIYSSIVTIIIISILVIILESPAGRVLRAIRDNELAAVSLGKNNIHYKMISVAIASGSAAVAGTIYASYTTYIDPTSFSATDSILFLSMVVIGGSGNIKGSVVGALIFILLPELIRFVVIPESIAANLRMIIYGLLLILLMLFRPQGLLGKYKYN